MDCPIKIAHNLFSNGFGKQYLIYAQATTLATGDKTMKMGVEKGMKNTPKAVIAIKSKFIAKIAPPAVKAE